MNNDDEITGELTGKSGKVKVMYVRRDENNDPERRGAGSSFGDGRRRDKNSGRDRGDFREGGHFHRRGGRSDNFTAGRERADRERTGKGRRDNDRDRSGRTYSERENNNPWRRDDSERSGKWRDADPVQHARAVSPWSTSSRLTSLPDADDLLPVSDESDHGGISGKSDIDPEILRRQRSEESRIYGENACLALFGRRPESIVRGWFAEGITPRFRDALRWLAANRKAYHIVEDDELTKVSGTEHHGGVCFLIKKRPGISVSDWLTSQPASGRQCVLALENVANPHNLGAIMRSCAHFGVNSVLTDNPALLDSGAAARTAEGGAEHVQAITSDDFIAALKQLRKAGYCIVATSSHKGCSLFNASLPEKMVLLLGQERDGISAAALALADMRLAISGTGQVESLNVSVATGILLAEWWRQGAIT